MAFSSQNRTEKGVVSAEKDAPKRIGFRHGADLRLGAIKADQRKRRKGEREREREKSPKTVQNISKNILKGKNVCMGMHEHVTCNIKSIIRSAQSKPTSTQSVAHI